MKLPQAPERTTPSFAFSAIERALRQCLATRRFGRDEIHQVLDFFGKDRPECVFCGSRDVKRWDHLVAVKEGGETVLGNMVPACARCDDSKRNLPFEEWMKSGVGGSPTSRGISDVDQRIEQIKGYIQHFGYVPRTLEQRLDEREQGRLRNIRSRLQEVRQDTEKLIQDYRERTGNT